MSEPDMDLVLISLEKETFYFSALVEKGTFYFSAFQKLNVPFSPCPLFPLKVPQCL